MSNPTSNKELFKQLLDKLLRKHKLGYDEISAATGITTSVLKNAANDTPEEPRAFKASTIRVNALRAYLDTVENGALAILPPEAHKTNEEMEELRARVRALEEKLEQIYGKEKNGVN